MLLEHLDGDRPFVGDVDRWPASRSRRASERAASGLSSASSTVNDRSGTCGSPASTLRVGLWSFQGRQTYQKLAPLPLTVAVRRDAAAVHLDQAAGQRQPDAQASLGRFNDWSTCMNSSKMRGRTSGSMPMPVSRIADDDLFALLPCREPDRAPRVSVLGGIGQEIDEDLVEASRVGLEADGAGGQAHREGMLPLGDERNDISRRLLSRFRPVPPAPSAARPCGS